MKLEIANQRDKKKYCHFHDDYRHTTDECQQLKDEIKKLIRQGNLKRFARTEGRQEKLKDKSQEKYDKEKPIGVINVIAGGPKGHKSSNKRAAEALNLENIFSIDTKSISRDPIIFELKDYENIKRPHSPPVVNIFSTSTWYEEFSLIQAVQST
ncbi:hypothetical protein P3X46_011622 [Hevea brasiliensis]|uniref:Reverse transcriptase domain-containing protein n=1 Tax=Hevea brasiliensis TaxID=3981 RepID=A0ABQ9M7W4_HEVBR|nr:hypothetical protein P3X46_011622 [Hevea brasiliensis]